MSDLYCKGCHYSFPEKSFYKGFCEYCRADYGQMKKQSLYGQREKKKEFKYDGFSIVDGRNMYKYEGR